MYATCLDTLIMNSAQRCLCSEILTEPYRRVPEQRSYYFKPLGSKGPVAIEGSSWGHFLETLSALTGGRGKEHPNSFAPGAKGKRENGSLWGSGQLGMGELWRRASKGSLAQFHLALSPLLHIWNQQAA